MEKVSAVYQIINTVTNDRYVGSSRNVKHRWENHKCPSTWKKYPNSLLYHDMQKYGLDKFRFQILAPVMPEYLKQVEQEFIDMLHPTYNNYNAKGWDVEKQKESNKKYQQSKKGKEAHRKASRKYFQSEKGKETRRKAMEKYRQTDKGKEYSRKYDNQLCSYEGETLTLAALRWRFKRTGIKHSTLEAKKYLIK